MYNSIVKSNNNIKYINNINNNNKNFYHLECLINKLKL